MISDLKNTFAERELTRESKFTMNNLNIAHSSDTLEKGVDDLGPKTLWVKLSNFWDLERNRPQLAFRQQFSKKIVCSGPFHKSWIINV